MATGQRLSEQLSDTECLDLLSSVNVGRVVFTMGALPAIAPVSFAVEDGDIVFATTSGSPVAKATDEAVVAFEAGVFGDETAPGWSVSLTGLATSMPYIGRKGLEHLVTWTPAQSLQLVRIHPAGISGFRLLPATNSSGSSAAGTTMGASG